MIKTFTEYICDIILEQIASGKEPIIVLPNKRPIAYMQKYMAGKMKQAIWFPKIYTIEDFVLHITNMQVAEPNYTANCLFKIYNEALQDQADSFDDFIKWWSLVIADFNDIDMYMVDADQLFNYINEAKAIENWNPGEKEPTKLQQHYLSFWKYLPLFYKQLNDKLSDEQLGYRGMLYKKAAKMLQTANFQLGQEDVIFAGFNALSTAEEMIIERFLKDKKGAIYWEADDYYLQDKKQEAGKFLRHYKTKWQQYSNAVFFSNNLLLNNPIKINVLGAPKSMMQAALAGKIAKQLLQNKNTALIPADESLLTPLLYQLPQTKNNEINISMGYPIATLPLNGLYVIILDFIEQLVKDKQAIFNTHLLHQLFSHPYASILFNNNKHYEAVIATKKLIQKILGAGKINYNLSELKSLNLQFNEIDFYWFFETLIEDDEARNLFPSILHKTNEKLIIGANTAIQLKELLLLQVHLYQEILSDIIQVYYHVEETNIKQAKTLFTLIHQALLSKSLPFIGNATGGMQFIGLLETRMLQFDEIIITGCNEGILPSAKAIGNSFIPYDIRHQFNLPTYKDSEAVFAYHFYRLIQGAQQVYLIYNTETDEFGSGEKSRFLIQLEMELKRKNPAAAITSEIIKLPALNNFSRKNIQFEHTARIDETIKVLSEKGLSATALISYKNCSLQFYFKYIERIHEPDEIATEVGANIVGSVIHAVLEEIYAPFKNQYIVSQQLQRSFSELEVLTRKAFEKIEPGVESSSGKNLLFIQTSVRIVANFLAQEQKSLKNGVALRLLHTEQQFECNLNVEKESIKLRGTIDRIDEWDNKVRIIDYKTGVVDPKKLKVEAIETVFEDAEYDKAFQLLFYTLLYRKNATIKNQEVEAGILSLRKISEGLHTISTVEENETILEKFEQHLVALIAQLHDEKLPFIQTTNTDICSYCAYANICMR